MNITEWTSVTTLEIYEGHVSKLDVSTLDICPRPPPQISQKGEQNVKSQPIYIYVSMYQYPTSGYLLAYLTYAS